MLNFGAVYLLTNLPQFTALDDLRFRQLPGNDLCESNQCLGSAAQPLLFCRFCW